MRGLRAEQCGAAPGPGHKCSSQSSRRADGRGARPATREKSDFLTGSDEGVAADTDAKADASEEGAVGKWQAVQPDKEQKLDRAGWLDKGSRSQEAWRGSGCGRASRPPRGSRRASTDRCAASRLEDRAAPSCRIEWRDVVRYDSV